MKFMKTSQKVQYDKKTDSVIYAVRSFDAADWARLSMAAADQSGMNLSDQEKLGRMFARMLGSEFEAAL